MLKEHFKHFVPLAGKDPGTRAAAAEWAFGKFGVSSVEIFYCNNKIPGFWFEKEKDAVLFALKWS